MTSDLWSRFYATEQSVRTREVTERREFLCLTCNTFTKRSVAVQDGRLTTTCLVCKEDRTFVKRGLGWMPEWASDYRLLVMAYGPSFLSQLLNDARKKVVKRVRR